MLPASLEYVPCWKLTYLLSKALLKMIFLFPRWDLFPGGYISNQRNDSACAKVTCSALPQRENGPKRVLVGMTSDERDDHKFHKLLLKSYLDRNINHASITYQRP